VPDRRILVVLLLSFAVAAPAAALRLLCVGRACDRPSTRQAPVPYCSLPGEARDLLAAGFRDGRGPHVLAVAGDTPMRGATGLASTASWPSADAGRDDAVPLVFAGAGVHRGAAVPAGVRLDVVAPTVAELIGLERPHPGVRSGEAIPGVALGERPRLVLEIVWKGVGSGDLHDAGPSGSRTLRTLLRDGAGTLDAGPGSLPLDPTAVLTTIGTGGLPRDHGITGTLVRNDDGRVVTAWGRGSPFSVIATLGDDLDELMHQAPRIGLVATAGSDRGLIGGNWYIDNDRDDVVLERGPRAQAAEAGRLLASGYGRDEVPDLLAVAMDGPVPAMDRAAGRLVEEARRASGGLVAVVLTATGSLRAESGVSASSFERSLDDDLGADVVEATALGGVFLDQRVMTASGITDDRVIRAVRGIRGPDGDRLVADVFPQIAVTFARYC
jgi:hypothetical protein